MITLKAEIDLQALVDIQVSKNNNVCFNSIPPTAALPIMRQDLSKWYSNVFYFTYFCIYRCAGVCVDFFQLVCVLGDELDSISQTIRKCRFMCRCHLSVPLYERARKDSFAIG